jgi:hypothetical protein
MAHGSVKDSQDADWFERVMADNLVEVVEDNPLCFGAHRGKGVALLGDGPRRALT